MAAFVLVCSTMGYSSRAEAVVPGGWTAVGAPDFSAGQAQGESLAFSLGSTPYVAYTDIANGGKATVMAYDGSAWVAVGSAGFTAGAANYPSLAFSGATPYLAYADDYGYKATVARFNGTAWVPVGSPDFSANKARNISLAFSGTGTPYVAYNDCASDPDPEASTEICTGKVMMFDGTDWVEIGSPGFAAGGADFVSLAVSSDDTPHVAYSDSAASGTVTVKQFDGSDWVLVGSSGFSAGRAEFPSLAFSGTTPYVAYTDDANGLKATVKMFDGTNWVDVGPPDFSTGPAGYVSLAFSGGVPYVAYEDDADSLRATVKMFDGTGWVTMGSPNTPAGPAEFVSLAISGDGVPHVAYMDILNGQKATVMKFSLVPSVTTTHASSMTTTTAMTGGNVTSDNGYAVTARGVCVSGSNNPPTLADTCTSDGTGTGAFTSSLTGLLAGAGYNLRAYATNSEGTGYGSNMQFYTHTTVTASAGTGGSISPAGVADTGLGGGQTYTITANTGYRILDVAVDGSSVGNPASFPFTNVLVNHTIDATFQKTWSLSATAGTGGTIAPSGSTTVDDGAAQTFSIVPGTGYDILDVTVNGTSAGAVSSLPLTFSRDTSVVATFVAHTPGVTPSTPTAQSGTGVTLTPTAVPGAVSYDYDFGNGHSLLGQSTAPVAYDYATAGSYTVTLTAKDGGNAALATATTTVEVNYGRIEVAPLQSSPSNTVVKATETLSPVTGTQLQTRYGVADTNMQPLRDASDFTATLTQAHAPAAFRISMYDVPGAVNTLRLVKLKANGTNREYVYGSSASFDEDGHWWITDAQGYDIPLTGTLAPATLYWVNFVIVDGGPYDDDGLANGSIVDPVTIARSGAATTVTASDGGGGGGCVYLPMGGGGVELALVLGGVGAAVLRRRRR